LSDRSGAWWASSRRNSLGAKLGAVAIIAALAAVSVVVWVSPATSPVTQVSRLTEMIAMWQQLAEEHRELQGEVSQLEGQLDLRDARLEELEAQLDAAEQELAASMETLGETEQALAMAQLALAATNEQPSSGGGGGEGGRSAPQRDEPVTAPPIEELVAPESPYFGLYTEQAPFNFATFDAVSLKTGAVPSMVGYFQGWDQEFRPDAVTRAWDRDMLPMLTWESRPIAAQNDSNSAPEYSLPLILDGAFDDYLRRYAEAIVDTGLPLAIRLNHEMNGNWYPWSEDDGRGGSINGNRPGDYAAVWRHVHDIFEEAGANDYVIWVWAPNRVDLVPTAHRGFEYTQSLYPGDEYVDWVGMSGYLRPPVEGTIGFDPTYGATLDQLRRLTDKPIVLAEVGATESGGRKAEWVRSFFEGLNSPENDDIVGFAWFNLAVTTFAGGDRTTNDWRIDSRADSLAAFSEGLLGEGTRFRLEPAPTE